MVQGSKPNNDNNKSSVVTFSTNFVFTINPKYPDLGGHSLAFVLFSAKQPMGSLANQYLGLPNDTSNAQFATRILAIETWSLISNVSEPVAYYLPGGNKANNSVNLKSGDPIQAWVEYNSQENLTSVTVSPLGIPRPSRPLISFPIDLSSVLNEYMYVGYSASKVCLQLLIMCLDGGFRSLFASIYIAKIGKDKLFLAYDYVPNGSLDRQLSNSQKKKVLTWEQRYKILIGVAQALLYLHEDCDQMVDHIDVKPSNVLIDADLNVRLGDFGLGPGYLAPELTKTGKATTRTDVYSYDALMLEVAIGRWPIEPKKSSEELVLVDCVRELKSRVEVTKAIDPTLEEYNADKAELVLSLGLLCSHPNPDFRPSMRRVVQFLLGDASLPQLPHES
ncbi:L-type lectin-domain containing receptor kinase S.4-like [Actinidia eriantha]|uniref:L-type lectin-domain containing receptor kinase S.4-like n=1 Tax=Actinidia eriantha TaxID=165200 RepID=UPI002582C03E|nr:L-type lectin-domain containing receptor kinase S.4-like [Actinidia eriantha]